MTIVSDASSIILLAKAGVLEIFVKRNRVVVPKLVYEEVIRGRNKGRADSMLMERLVAEKNISVASANRATREKIEGLFNLKGGELDVIAMSFGNKRTVLTDDKKCLNAAKALKIDFITSLDVVAALRRKGAISKESALDCIDKLGEYGWYSRDIIKLYRGEIK